MKSFMSVDYFSVKTSFFIKNQLQCFGAGQNWVTRFWLSCDEMGRLQNLAQNMYLNILDMDVLDCTWNVLAKIKYIVFKYKYKYSTCKNGQVPSTCQVHKNLYLSTTKYKYICTWTQVCLIFTKLQLLSHVSC